MLLTLNKTQFENLIDQVNNTNSQMVKLIIPVEPFVCIEISCERARGFIKTGKKLLASGYPLYLKVIPDCLTWISTNTLKDAFKGVEDSGNIAIFDAGEYGRFMEDLCDHDIKMIGVYTNFGEDATKHFEKEQKNYLFDQCAERTSEIFLDIGANHGAYSVYAYKRGTFKKIHAFEPFKRTFEFLRINLEILNYCNYGTCRNIAISNNIGVKDFSILPNASGASGITEDNFVLNSQPGVHPFIIEQVKTSTIDELFSLRGKKLAFKIDIEGHELSAIRGMATTLVTNDCFLQIESFENNCKALFELMNEYNYCHYHSIGDDYYFERNDL